MAQEERGIVSAPLYVSAALLIASTLLVWPRPYYLLSRFIVCGTAVYVIWHCFRTHHRVWAILLGIIAVLFNPIVPIRFDRNPWHAVEFVAALIFIVSALGFRAEERPRRLRSGAN